MAIKAVESSGGNYGALGKIIPKTGDRAYGAYQVMGNNIPSWTKDALGRSMTPDEFLRDREAQDAVFRNQFGSYVKRYGNADDAASAWFTGRPLSQGAGAVDPLGTTGSGYVRKFNESLPPRASVSQPVAPLAASVAAPSALPSMPALDASLRSVNDNAATAAQGVSSLSSNLDPLAQTSQGLQQVGTTLGSTSGGASGGGLLGQIASLIGGAFGGSGAAATAATAAAPATVAAAGGGHIRGPGTATSDSILARLSNGEFVVNAASTARHLDVLHAINDNRDRRLPAFAGGGAVGEAPVARFNRQQREGGAVPAPAAPAAPIVHVHNNAGAEVATEASQDASGRPRLDVFLDKAVAGGVSRPGSKTGKALRRTFGLSRKLPGRS